jgi:hypothetical protein
VPVVLDVLSSIQLRITKHKTLRYLTPCSPHDCFHLNLVPTLPWDNHRGERAVSLS